MSHIDLLIHNAAQLVTCVAQSGGPVRGKAMLDPGIVSDGAIAIHKGSIIAVGRSGDITPNFTAAVSIDARGRVVCPGFVDAHTHIVYAGDRVGEFEMRIQGAAYLEILAAGGGIVSTTRQVRQASVADLVEQTLPRLETMLRHGATTVEIKTGYGLDTASELKILHAIEELARRQPVTLVPTFLAAHAVPPEFSGRADDYVDLVIDSMIPPAADWYQSSSFAAQTIPFFIDVFCEKNAFSLDQSRRVLEAGVKHGMRVKAHVDEFVNLGGSLMASALGAVSIDHLDATTSEQIAEIAGSSTVCVAIPAVNFHLGNPHYANARGMIDAGAAVALATDFNPGSAPCPSIQFVMALACRYQRMLPAEALLASTINGAYAVGLGNVCGSLEPGKWADVLIVDAADYRHLTYQFGGNLVRQVIRKGHIVWSRN
jgi:imidazolonepropionase